VDVAESLGRGPQPPGETQILPVSTLRAGARGPGLLAAGDVNVLVVRRGIRARSLDALAPYGETIQPYAGVLVIER
jgi:hypothetical protein